MTKFLILSYTVLCLIGGYCVLHDNTDSCLQKINSLNPTLIFDFYGVPKEYRKNLVFDQNYAMAYTLYQLHYCTIGQKMYGE